MGKSRLFLLIIIIEGISALGAEFRRMMWIRGHPAAFIAFVERFSLRFGATALLAELALIYGTAFRAGPALYRFWFRLATSATEFACIAFLTAGTIPAWSTGSSACHHSRTTLRCATLRTWVSCSWRACSSNRSNTYSSRPNDLIARSPNADSSTWVATWPD